MLGGQIDSFVYFLWLYNLVAQTILHRYFLIYQKAVELPHKAAQETSMAYDNFRFRKKLTIEKSIMKLFYYYELINSVP